MTAPHRAALLLALLIAAGCAGPWSRSPATGSGAATSPGGVAIANGHLLGELERRHPDLALGAEALRAAERAGREALTAPIGARTAWSHPDSNTRGGFTALRAYTSAAGSHCREILTEVVAPSGTYTGPSLACRRVDGRWYLLN